MIRMIREAALQEQFNRALRLGWLAYIQHALYCSNGVTPALVLAVCSRETNLDPRYLEKPGDGGHGFGLCQADIRAFPEWIKSGKWQHANECFAFCANLLANEIQHYLNEAAKPGDFQVTDRLGRHYSVPRKPLDANTALQVAIASYNCGAWAYYHFCKGRDIDTGTTPGPSGGPDYSIDVLNRAEVFERLLAKQETGAVHAIAQPAPAEVPHQPAQAAPVEVPHQPAQAVATTAQQPKPPALPPTPAAPPDNGFSVVSITDKIQEARGQYDQLEKALPDFVKRPGSVKAFRLWLGNLTGGGAIGLTGLFSANKTIIYIGLGLAVFITLAYFARQWHLDALFEKHNRTRQ